ncbi:MAG: ChrB protein [Chloroflexi bacterium]|nr:ChrB protein [Chloroflexota bacterium]
MGNEPPGDGQSWLLLLYTVPREPTAPRVAVWRKLKRLGAVLMQDAAWVLPATPWTLEQFQWLAAEIAEADGEATVWESRLVRGQDEALTQQFLAYVEPAYAEILTSLQAEDANLAALSRTYQEVRRRDYLQSELGKRVRDALLAATGRREP